MKKLFSKVSIFPLAISLVFSAVIAKADLKYTHSQVSAMSREEILERIDEHQNKASDLREELRNAKRIETVHGPFYPIPNIARFITGVGLTASFIAATGGALGLLVSHMKNSSELVGGSVLGLYVGGGGILSLTIPYLFLYAVSRDEVKVVEIPESEKIELENILDQELEALAVLRAGLSARSNLECQGGGC